MSIAPMTPLPSSEEELIEESVCEIYEMAEKNVVARDQVEAGLLKTVAVNILDRLMAGHYAVEQGGRVQLTPDGEAMALQVLRRKRLAERLMKDVLNLPDEVIESAACQWEHVLSKEVTNSICTFLGHPTFSPRDEVIPEGECCRREEKQVSPVICALESLQRGDRGKIMYLLIKQRPELSRLLSMGLMPGVELALLQRVPTFVVQVGETQLAFDESIASGIFVHPI